MQADMPDHLPGMLDTSCMPDHGQAGSRSLFQHAGFHGAKRRLHSRDTAATRFVFNLTRGSRGEAGAVMISRLGNGWLYLFLTPFALLELHQSRCSGLLTAGANVAVSHSIYPWIKRRIRRIRPFKADPSVASLLMTKDEFSFPSGHTMTLAAFLTPVVYLNPRFWIPGLFMVIVMAWARVAAGHHYPTDVFAGAALGGIIGYIMSTVIL